VDVAAGRTLKGSAPGNGEAGELAGFTVRLPAEHASVSEARRAVSEHLRDLRVSQEQLEAAQIGLSEAVGNVVCHAYRDDEAGELEVEVRPDPDCFHLQVRDCGCGPSRARPESAGSGFGTPLMQAVSLEFELDERVPQGTEVRMTFPRH
jgi:anti-sigma regulatory factor (Ser/Thr protein kinase)